MERIDAEVALRLPFSQPLEEAEVRRELREARQSLLPVEAALYEDLNREVAEALTDVLSTARPHTPERQVAAELGARVIAILNQAFTWNPSGPGVKIEDTVLLTADGVRVLSVDERWPTTAVNGLQRPVTLEI